MADGQGQGATPRLGRGAASHRAPLSRGPAAGAAGPFRALKLGDAAKVAPIDKLSVVLVAVFAVLFLGEKLSGANWLGIVLIACGTILVAYRG